MRMALAVEPPAVVAPVEAPTSAAAAAESSLWAAVAAEALLLAAAQAVRSTVVAGVSSPLTCRVAVRR
jgi:hypothetical protein